MRDGERAHSYIGPEAVDLERKKPPLCMFTPGWLHVLLRVPGPLV